MSGDPRGLGPALETVYSTMLADALETQDRYRRQLLGLPPDTRTPEQKAADLEKHRADSVIRRTFLAHCHAQLIAAAEPIARAVLELHAPAFDHAVAWSSWAVCHGCEMAGSEAEPPDYPCRTYELVAAMVRAA